jgi:hypothetical protein
VTARAIVAKALLILALAWPGSAGAQVFLASEPHPDFSVGPIFAIANVKPDLSLVINLSFSLVPRVGARTDALDQDLYLLWPAEIVEATAARVADPVLAREIERRGLVVVSSGRLALRSRDRTLVGTDVLGDPVAAAASFVTFTRRGPIGSRVSPVTYVKLPRTPKFADPLNVMTLAMPVRGLVTPKPASTLSELFWGRRWILTVSFGDLGSPVVPIYPVYFEHRDRVVRLGRDFSSIAAIFADADHLLIDTIEPAAATRRPSRVRAGGEVVSLALTPTDGVTPQTLKVQFSYFAGSIAWRPILVSMVLLVLANIAGLFMFGREMLGVIKKRRRARAAAARLLGTAFTTEALARLQPGVTTYDNVIAGWGRPDDEHEQIAPPGRRTLVYRAARNGFVHEVEITLDGVHVSEVTRRVRKVDTSGSA